MRGLAFRNSRQPSTRPFQRASSNREAAESEPPPLTPVEVPYPGGAPRSVMCPKCGKRTKSTLGACRHCGKRLGLRIDLSKTILDTRSPEEISQAARTEAAWVSGIALGACFLVVALYEIYGSGREHRWIRPLLAQSAEWIWSISLIIDQGVR